MINKYSSENRYYKYFSYSGDEIRIKLSKHLNFPTKITVKFQDDSNLETIWNFHSPSKKFENCQEVISYIVKNAEKSKVFKIV